MKSPLDHTEAYTKQVIELLDGLEQSLLAISFGVRPDFYDETIIESFKNIAGAAKAMKLPDLITAVEKANELLGASDGNPGQIELDSLTARALFTVIDKCRKALKYPEPNPLDPPAENKNKFLRPTPQKGTLLLIFGQENEIRNLKHKLELATISVIENHYSQDSIEIIANKRPNMILMASGLNRHSRTIIENFPEIPLLLSDGLTESEIIETCLTSIKNQKQARFMASSVNLKRLSLVSQLANVDGYLKETGKIELQREMRQIVNDILGLERQIKVGLKLD